MKGIVVAGRSETRGTKVGLSVFDWNSSKMEKKRSYNKAVGRVLFLIWWDSPTPM